MGNRIKTITFFIFLLVFVLFSGLTYDDEIKKENEILKETLNNIINDLNVIGKTYYVNNYDINNDSVFFIDSNTLKNVENYELYFSKLKRDIQYLTEKNEYPNVLPIKPKDLIKITSHYGPRKHPNSDTLVRMHEGVDFSAKIGKPVYSTANGVVVEIKYSPYGYGNRVVIKHKNGFETLYAHLNTIIVKENQIVSKNKKIGTVGNSGNSTGPHLHYEVRKNNIPINPEGYFFSYLVVNE